MKNRPIPLLGAALLAAGLAFSAPASAHCDTLDGPVVGTARHALESGRIEPVLAWVQKVDEKEIRDAFERARAVRRTGGAAAELADRWFYETLVRVHRAGEGAPFTGLKPAGSIEPSVAAADKALATGRLEPVATLLTEATHDGLHRKYEAAAKLSRRNPADVEAGRAYVQAYVAYVHYVERVHEAAAGEGGHAVDEVAAPSEHRH